MNVMKDEEIGFVSINSTPNELTIIINKNKRVQIDDIVYFLSDGIVFYGIVTDISKTSPDTDTYYHCVAAKENKILYDISHSATIKVIRTLPPSYEAPDPFSPVFIAHEEHLDKALYFDSMTGNKVAAGLLPSGEAAYIDYDFLSGNKGGHVSITGISGIAAKTSYITFLAKSIFSSKDISHKTKNAKFVFFNMKGEDSLFLDKENKNLSDSAKSDYLAMGISPEPFKSVSFYAPSAPNATFNTMDIPATKERKDGVAVYRWSMKKFAEDRLLSFMFKDVTENVSFIIERVSSILSSYARKTSVGPHINIKGNIIRNLDELQKMMEDEVDEEGQSGVFFTASMLPQSRWAFLRRFEGASFRLRDIVGFKSKGDGSGDIPHQPIEFNKQVNVIDINSLDSTAQNFVVSSVIKKVYDRRQVEDSKAPLFIVVDELNKYAPKSGYSPIKSIMSEIAERGRSLGIILIGGQQMASEIEKRVYSNCAIKVLGRMDAAEIQQPEYSYLLKASKTKAVTMSQGSMIIYQPSIPSALSISFPYPAWATKASEVADDENIDDLVDDLNG